MTTVEKIALAAVIVPSAISLGALISSLLNRKKIGGIHIDINSRMTELLQATKGQATAEGHAVGAKEEREDERSRRMEK